MKKIITLALLFVSVIAHSQLLTWSPQFPTATSTINITMNAAQGNQALMGYSGKVYMHLGVITNLSTGPSDWRYVITTWGVANSYQAGNIGTNLWAFSIDPSVFNVPAGETILEVALLYRTVTGDTVQRNADGGDIKIPIYAAGSNNIIFTNPVLVPENYPISNAPITAPVGQAVTVKAVASTTAGTLNLYFNGTQIAGPVTSTNSITGSATATNTGLQQFVAQLTVGGVSSYDTINYFITPPTTVAALPAAVVINNVPHEGINYYGCSDSVTLVLYAPHKTSSVLIGDFANSNWLPQTQNQMYQTPDSSYYWITIHGLTPGTQYAFQYLVDNSIYIADPYSEEILDGVNDGYIPASTYPNLKPYPTNSNVSTGKNGLIGVLQTCAPQYTWKATNFIPPNKQDLIIEEVLVRDFATVDGNGNFQLLLDSLHYFKSLGINAIELMPICEFSGNDSWGYNPNFYCALDKAYGTKAMYKTFIDSCHANGIAIIMDVVYNQVDDNNDQVPEARLYWDPTAVPYPSTPTTIGAPAANNPWLNQAAPHPYGDFDDLNHESTATQYWVERSLSYWLTEYHVDGFRFDLAKGFTQNCTNGVDLTCPNGNNSSNSSVENYDASRVANLERYYNYVQSNHLGSTMPYMILEFLGSQNDNNPNSEEATYANYGFMLWNDIGNTGSPNVTWFQDNTEGNSANSNLSKAVYNSNEESFSVPASVSYTNSHDDQRIMYSTEFNGVSANVTSVAGQGGALQRQAAAAAILFSIPGPHMFYEFDERGNDTSQVADGGNTSYKNPLWQYLTTDANAAARRACMNNYSQLINLRLSNPSVFNSTNFSYDLYDVTGNPGLVKRFQIGDPAAGGMQVTVIANFYNVAATRSVTFQTTGNWYNYQSNGTGSGINGATGTTFNLSSATQSLTLQPGEYHVYVYQPPTTYTFIGNGNWTTPSNWMYGSVPPATLPSGSQIIVDPQPGGEAVLNTTQTISEGATFTVISNKTLSIPMNLVIQQ